MFRVGLIKKTKDTGIARVVDGGIQRNLRLVNFFGFLRKPKEKNCFIINMGSPEQDVVVAIDNKKRDLKDNDLLITDDKSTIHFDFKNGNIIIKTEKLIVEAKEKTIEADKIEMKGKELVMDYDKIEMKGKETKVDTTTLELKGTGEMKMETATLDIKANASTKLTSAKTEVTGIFDVKGALANNGFDVGNTHMHPTAAIGPPSPPTPVPVGV